MMSLPAQSFLLRPGKWGSAQYSIAAFPLRPSAKGQKKTRAARGPLYSSDQADSRFLLLFFIALQQAVDPIIGVQQLGQAAVMVQGGNDEGNVFAHIRFNEPFPFIDFRPAVGQVTKTSLPSTVFPMYSWAMMGLRPLTIRV